MTAHRYVFCRSCQTETPQAYSGVDTTRRTATYWRCLRCSTVYLTYADVHDANGFARTAAARWLNGAGAGAAQDARGLDRDELVAVAELELWLAYLAWQPQSSLRFRAYATTRVDQRLTDWLRRERGRIQNWRTGQPQPGKAHATAFSLDADGNNPAADRLDEALGHGSSDLAEDRSPDLTGLLDRRDKRLLRAARKLGIRPPR